MPDEAPFRPPRPPHSRLLRLIPVALVLAAGLALVAGLAVEAAREFRNLRTAGLDNVQWTASQLEVDVLRLELAAQRALRGDGLDPVRTRFDVLYSRVNILQRGQVGAEMPDDAQLIAGLATLRAFLDGHVAMMDGPDEALRAGLPDLIEATAALHAPVRQTVLRVLDRFAQSADAQREALAELLVRVALVAGALVALLLALVGLLARLHARQQRAQAELRVARDAALAGQRAKASFVAVMSHEMRTPLNGILASLEIVRPRIRDPGQAEFVALAHSSALQLMHQINDVLDIARIEAGRVAVTPAPLALAPFLEETAASLRPLAEARGNRLVLAAAPDLPSHVSADGFRLRQILQNFLSNAIKFTADGQVTLTARRVPGGEGHGLIEFEVIDTGVGIAAEDLGRVFDDFVMLDPTYSREVGGSGLGLAICRRLSAAMDGEIGADSTPGRGSRFWVRLPLPAIAPPAATAEASTPDPMPPPDAAPLHLLVVDDNAVNRTVIARMLSDDGHRVRLATSGIEAVALAGETRFDAILMDISMPEMDGVTAACHIRAGGPSAAVPIYALTAHAMPQELARFEAAGLRTSLLKPVRLSALRRAMAEIRSEASPAAAASPIDPPGHAGPGAEAPPHGAPRRPSDLRPSGTALPVSASAAPPETGPGSGRNGTPASGHDPPAPSIVARPLVDEETVREHLELLGPEAMADLRAQFVAHTDHLMDRLAASVAATAARELEALAHELKGAAGTLGLMQLSEAMRRLEAAARDDPGAMGRTLAEAEPIWRRSRSALTETPLSGEARAPAAPISAARRAERPKPAQTAP